MENKLGLSVDSQVFDQFRTDFNFVLQKLIKNMLDKDSTDGSISVKIDVELDQEYIPDFTDGQDGSDARMINKPCFKHKIGSTVTIKDEKTGKKDTEMELVWDEETKQYVLRFIANTEQRSMFDDDNGTFANAETYQEQAPAQIEGPVADETALPDDIIDAEYKEIEDTMEYDEPEE